MTRIPLSSRQLSQLFTFLLYNMRWILLASRLLLLCQRFFSFETVQPVTAALVTRIFWLQNKTACSVTVVFALNATRNSVSLEQSQLHIYIVQDGIYVLCTPLHSTSLKFPQHCLSDGSNVHLLDDASLLSFQGGLSSTSSFHASILQVTDGVMS